MKSKKLKVGDRVRIAKIPPHLTIQRLFGLLENKTRGRINKESWRRNRHGQTSFSSQPSGKSLFQARRGGRDKRDRYIFAFCSSRPHSPWRKARNVGSSNSMHGFPFLIASRPRWQ